MSEEKGFLNKDQEKAVARLVDDAIKLKGVMELGDGIVALVLIGLLDNELLHKQVIERNNVSVDTIEQVRVFADQVLEQDWEGAAETIAGLTNELINIPGLDEESEGMMLLGLFMMIAGAIKDKQQSA